MLVVFKCNLHFWLKTKPKNRIKKIITMLSFASIRSSTGINTSFLWISHNVVIRVKEILKMFNSEREMIIPSISYMNVQYSIIYSIIHNIPVHSNNASHSKRYWYSLLLWHCGKFSLCLCLSLSISLCLSLSLSLSHTNG